MPRLMLHKLDQFLLLQGRVLDRNKVILCCYLLHPSLFVYLGPRQLLGIGSTIQGAVVADPHISAIHVPLQVLINGCLTV